MDLRLTAKVAATEEERRRSPRSSACRVGLAGRLAAQQDAHASFGGHAARARHHLLITVLHALQERVGWISPGALDHIGERLDLAPAVVFGVASFYALFRTEPSPGAVVHVCDDVACAVNGAERLCAAMTRRFGGEGTETAFNGAGVTWQRSPCLGQCDRGSAALIQHAGGDPARRGLAPATPELLWAALTGQAEDQDPSSRTDPALRPAAQPDLPRAGPVSLLRRAGRVDPASLGSYRAAGGYQMLRRAFELGPQGVVREVRDAKLMGRGGAAFPTAIKWEGVAGNPVRPHYVVCNADESEPGTFKDRVLMEQDPYALIEAVTIMGYACSAAQGFIYIRGEYPLAEARLRHAIEQARVHGFLGPDVMGEGLAFDIEVRRGAGAYIAGEETALINSLEGKRAEPRNKPPFPAQSGLFGKPTAINNVETLLSVLELLRVGGAAFASVGTEASTGTRLFCLSGCVGSPGLYEYEFGVTLARRHRRGRRGPRRSAGAGGAARRRGRRVRRAVRPRHAAHLRGGQGGGRDPRLRRRAGARRHGGRAAATAPDHPVLPRRILRPVRALPGRHRPPGGTGGAAAVRRPARRGRGRARAAGRDRHGHPRRVDLRPRPDRAVGRPVGRQTGPDRESLTWRLCSWRPRGGSST